ncbi:MAG: carboxypeptidase-like regulatory domain-containing protein, partial [Tannerella sp.]|nr:carboxypeptidase-like regulatory domain-containing protein [Tannerella sp.]
MPNIKKVIIPTITILLFHITAFAQITLNMNKVTVKAAMEKLKNDYGYSFVFESGDVNTRKSISVRLQNKSISETAEQILQGQEVTHEIRDNNIIVRKKSALPNPSATQQNPKIPVTGTVIDASGEPVVGANIAEKGTTNGTSTDANGKFTLNVESGGTLIISYIGYASQDIKIVDNKPLTITMTEDTQALDEVVVTALGIKRQAKALSYAAAEIKGDKIIPGAEVNVMNALAGKVAGVNISTTGTGIAGSSRVVIRGNTTINGDSNPLYV